MMTLTTVTIDATVLGRVVRSVMGASSNAYSGPPVGASEPCATLLP